MKESLGRQWMGHAGEFSARPVAVGASQDFCEVALLNSLGRGREGPRAPRWNDRPRGLSPALGNSLADKDKQLRPLPAVPRGKGRVPGMGPALGAPGVWVGLFAAFPTCASAPR